MLGLMFPLSLLAAAAATSEPTDWGEDDDAAGPALWKVCPDFPWADDPGLWAALNISAVPSEINPGYVDVVLTDPGGRGLLERLNGAPGRAECSARLANDTSVDWDSYLIAVRASLGAGEAGLADWYFTSQGWYVEDWGPSQTGISSVGPVPGCGRYNLELTLEEGGRNTTLARRRALLVSPGQVPWVRQTETHETWVRFRRDNRSADPDCAAMEDEIERLEYECDDGNFIGILRGSAAVTLDRLLPDSHYSCRFRTMLGGQAPSPGGHGDPSLERKQFFSTSPVPDFGFLIDHNRVRMVAEDPAAAILHPDINATVSVFETVSDFESGTLVVEVPAALALRDPDQAFGGLKFGMQYEFCLDLEQAAGRCPKNGCQSTSICRSVTLPLDLDHALRGYPTGATVWAVLGLTAAACLACNAALAALVLVRLKRMRTGAEEYAMF